MILFVQRAQNPTKVEEAWKLNSKENYEFIELKRMKNLNESFFSVTFILKTGSDLWMRKNLNKKKSPWKERFLFPSINYFESGATDLIFEVILGPKILLECEWFWAFMRPWLLLREGGQWLKVGRLVCRAVICLVHPSVTWRPAASASVRDSLSSWFGAYVRTPSEKLNRDCVFTSFQVVLVPTKDFGSLWLSEQLKPSTIGI